MADYKFEMFGPHGALTAVDKRDGGWYERQTDEAKKAFAVPVFMRFASCIKDSNINHEAALCLTNEFVNTNAEELMTTHPELLFRLSAMCGLGRKMEHAFLPMASKNKTTSKVHDILAKFNPSANDDEIELLLSQYTKESFKDFVESSGLPPEEIKDAIKIFAKIKK